VLVLVTYDVATEDPAGRRRLRRIAQTCTNYGQRVQYSVFECKVSRTQWTSLRLRLLDIMDATKDSLRFYFLDEDAGEGVEHHGVRRPIDLEGPLFA
jgi:CRISPR-associated protein Cas2